MNEWEAYKTVGAQRDDSVVRKTAADTQRQLNKSIDQSSEEDWSDISIHLPQVVGRYSSVNAEFKLARSAGGTYSGQLVIRDSQSAVPLPSDRYAALGITDELTMKATSVRQLVVRNASAELQRYKPDFEAVPRKVSEIVGCDGAIAAYCEQFHMATDDIDELTSIVNAFCGAVFAACPSSSGDAPITWSLLRLVFTNDTGRALRLKALDSALFNMSVEEFLADENAEVEFCRQASLQLNEFFALTDLALSVVN